MAMGTNYYFMSKNKELMQTCFAGKTECGVLAEEYSIVDEPFLGYHCHQHNVARMCILDMCVCGVGIAQEIYRSRTHQQR